MLRNRWDLLLLGLVLTIGGTFNVVKAQGLSTNNCTGSIILNPNSAKRISNADLSAIVVPEPLPPVKVNLPHERIGVNIDSAFNLSLNDAIDMALKQNLGIERERENIKISQYNLEAAQGVYNFVGSMNFNTSKNTSFFDSIVNRSVMGPDVKTSGYEYDINLYRQLSTGGNFKVDFKNSYQTTNNIYSVFDSRYRPGVNFTLTQPLARNFRMNENQRQIKSLKKQLDISDLEFRQKIIELVARVQTAYNNLQFTVYNERVQREAVELAAIQLRNTREMVEAGNLAPIDVISTETELERRKGIAIGALRDITASENVLKLLILNDFNSETWNQRINPTDQIDFTLNDLDLKSAFDLALQRRPEIKQLELQEELNKVNQQYYHNQLKPQVDLFMSVGGEGLGGHPQTAVIPGVTNTLVNNNYIGGFGRSIGSLFDFNSYQVGVTISFPFRNTTAKSYMQRALSENKQIDLQKKQLMLNISAEIRNSLQDLAAARQRLIAASALVKSAEEQLKGEEERFLAGLSTNFLVLERQNALSNARVEEVRARTDYNNAWFELQRVTANNIP